MQPRFEGNISMLNFLYELKDLKQLLRLLKAHPIRKIRNFLRRKRRWVDPTRPLAEAHLTWFLALKPLLSDISAISKQINEIVVQAQSEFADAGLGRNSRHYSETEVFTDTISWYGAPSYHLGDGSYDRQTFTATMEYNYIYSARNSLDAFMRYWGLVPTYEVLWNAVPFTFVIDYFIKVGDSIAAMEKDPNVDLKLMQYCESILSSRGYGRFLNPDHVHGRMAVIDRSLVQGMVHPRVISGTLSSLYTRSVVAPNKGAALPRLDPISPREGVTLAALLRCFL
jgi:hypothetical protein